MSVSLVIGASGQVGEHLFRVLNDRQSSVYGTFLPTEVNYLDKKNMLPLEMSDEKNVTHLINRIDPDVIYLSAALTNVDFCEEYPETSYKINVIGISNIIKEIKNTKRKLIFFSSDYIFDGKNGPYTETDIPNPISIYGMHKLIGEHLILANLDDYLIIRTTVVFGWENGGKNFAIRLLRTLSQGKPISVPVDQIGNPTYVNALVKIAEELVTQNHIGIINVVGNNLISRYQFAQDVAKVFEKDISLIKPTFTSELNQKALRPLHGGLTTDKLNTLLGHRLPDYWECLDEMKQTYPGQ